jgi:predicted transcriptional regulator
MPRKKSPTLTEAELRLMKVLWSRGASAVGEVVAALSTPSPPAYSSVLTTLRILERKGYVRHRKRGRAFVYHPVIEREQAQSSAVQYVVSRFFNDSAGALLLNVLQNERLGAEELRRLRRLIEEAE